MSNTLQDECGRLEALNRELLEALKAMVQSYRIPDHIKAEHAERYAGIWLRAASIIEKAEKGE